MKEIWKMPETLETPRLKLTKFKPEDLGEMKRIATELNAATDVKGAMPFYAFYVAQDDPQREKKVNEKAAKYLNGLIDVVTPEADIYGYAIRLNGKLIGYTGVWFVSEDNEILKDIGYFLSPRFQKQGYALEATAAMCGEFFKDFDTMVATTNPRNTPSVNLLQKVGFAQTGYIEKSKYDGDPRIKWRLSRETFLSTMARPGLNGA